jgi:hypothetical protein
MPGWERQELLRVLAVSTFKSINSLSDNSNKSVLFAASTRAAGKPHNVKINNTKPRQSRQEKRIQGLPTG